ncbi:hypothetical protein HanXRQr2_Chr05g0213271 [Helianthus annuus]|uniref:Uncharacterized protein n=1 Tax=Helianthus annuus TaxID=4232 RepID=A0A9K3NMJ3_HELAN|nr:hypothetical protein HanXRQr2_Chr05g0213271 [Helianthus annuus]
MSDQWPPESKEVPVLKFQDREVRLYQAAFPTFGGSMGVRPLEAGEQYWYDEIKSHFMYPVAGAFADPPIATEGAHIPNPRPLRALTSAGKEIVYLSSEESVGSSNGELSSWSNIFAGVLRELGIDPKDKKKKLAKRKKVITLDVEVTSKKGGSSRATAGVADKGTLRLRQSNLEDYVIISDSFEGLSRIGEKKTGAAGSKSSGSAGSRNPDAGATPSSITLDEEEEEEEEEKPAAKLVSRKRSKGETTVGPSVAQKTGGIPLIGKQSNLRSLYKFSPGSAIHKEKTAAAGGASSGGAGGFVPQSPIGPKDIVGDLYYKTYTEETCGNAPHQAPWGLKQKDTFMEFGACRGWFLNSFPPGEVNRQRARTHDGLYQAYVVGEANTRAANHQIVREWRTMVKERADWEKYRERLVRQVKDYEKAKAAFVEEKAKFESDRKLEEWGREGLRGKLRAAEDLLAKEKAEWKKICEKDN